MVCYWVATIHPRLLTLVPYLARRSEIVAQDPSCLPDRQLFPFDGYIPQSATLELLLGTCGLRLSASLLPRIGEYYHYIRMDLPEDS